MNICVSQKLRKPREKKMWVQELDMEQGWGTFDVQGNPRVIAMDKSDSRSPNKWNLLRSFSNMGLSR